MKMVITVALVIRMMIVAHLTSRYLDWAWILGQKDFLRIIQHGFVSEGLNCTEALKFQTNLHLKTVTSSAFKIICLSSSSYFPQIWLTVPLHFNHFIATFIAYFTFTFTFTWQHSLSSNIMNSSKTLPQVESQTVPLHFTPFLGILSGAALTLLLIAILVVLIIRWLLKSDVKRQWPWSQEKDPWSPTCWSHPQVQRIRYWVSGADIFFLDQLNPANGWPQAKILVFTTLL